jgi:hypothetical protein
VVCLGAVALLFVTLCRFELTAKTAGARLRRLRRVRDSGEPLPPAPVSQRPPRAEIPQVLH